jgi:hypothetical protein
VLKLRPGRKYTVLGDLAKRVGWKMDKVVAKLEDKRKQKGFAYAAKMKAAALKNKAIVQEGLKKPEVVKVLPLLQAVGF